MTTNKDILAVVVLYNSTLQSCNTYKTLLAKEVNLSVFIYDNSPVAQHYANDFNPSIYYISDPSNPGLSYAYNKAFQYAKANGFQWLLLLDQDTIFAENVISNYIEAVNQNHDCKIVVAPMQVEGSKFMSPVKKRFFGAKLENSVPSGITDALKYCAINSGMMINVDAFETVGGYNEKVFLDFSDYEFLDRFSRQYDTFYTLKRCCVQEFSNQVQTKTQKILRFKLFCSSLKYCTSDSFLQKISYFCIVTKRMLSLSLSTRSVVPLNIFIKYYL